MSMPPLIVLASMDAAFRAICAIEADGRCLIARGHERDARLRGQLVAWGHGGDIPWPLREESVEPEAVAAAWCSAANDPAGAVPAAPKDAGRRGGAAGVLRRTGDLLRGGGAAEAASDDAVMRRLGAALGEAAAVEASDIVFRLEGGNDSGGRAAAVDVIVNDRRLPLGDPWSPEVMSAALNLLFHHKSEGSRQSSYQRSSFQGFSIRSGSAIPLPPSVSGLRCERGPHDPEGDHLYARLFYRRQLRPDMTLEELGLEPAIVDVFAELRQARRGGIVIGGSTGDGKSTTLAVNLALQMREHGGALNLVTVEDPVEVEIPGALQIAVPTAGAGEERAEHFVRALMHFCRVHPGAGMVSEIRDAHAARQVLQFVDTGHQVWTTIHVDNANGILFRLLDMGVSTAEVCKPGNVGLLMKQTLLPRLCASCARETPADREVPGWLAPALRRLGGRVRFRAPDGCEACRRPDRGRLGASAWNGYAGRKAVAEHIRPDAGYLSYVRQGDPQGARSYWLDHGGHPIGTAIRDLVAAGQVDPFDAIGRGADLAVDGPRLVAGAGT